MSNKTYTITASGHQECTLPMMQVTMTSHAMEVAESAPSALCADSIARALSYWANMRQECFLAVYQNAQGAIIGVLEVSRGTLTSSLVHPREVFAPAIERGAASIIIAHNHPSGDTEPSAADITTTERLRKAGKLLGINVLDHVIIGHSGYYSFMEAGRM